jgi:transglutaminase-like putative cysteine protease
MRIAWGLLAWLLAGSVCAGEVEYQRGEFRFKVADAPAFVQRHDVPARWDASAPGASGAPWRFWLYDVQIDHRQGHDDFYVDYVYEAKAASLLGDAGRFQIEFNPGYQQLTIHRVELRRAGKWQTRLAPDRISLARRESEFEQDLADGEVTALIVLDDVRVDDVVRINYTITGSNPVLAGNTVDALTFGWRSPVLDARLRAVYDGGSELNVYRENNAPAPRIAQVDGRTEALFVGHGVPAYVDEDNYPIWYQPFPVAWVARKRSWGDVVNWALPLYPKAGAMPADLEAKIGQWRKLGDPYAQVKVALRTVQEQVRYFGVEMGENSHRPTPPADTWTRRYGDCKDKAYLLVTLLERMGIRAAPALVSTARGRAIASFTPAASVFNHVIVRAQVGDNVLWIDPTLTAQGGDPRDSDQSLYGVALAVAAGVTAPETIAAPKNADVQVIVNEHFVPAADGREVMLDVETTYQGRTADNVRRTFAGQRIEEVSRRYSDYYRQRFGEVEVATPAVVQDDLDRNRLTLIERYRLLSPFDSEDGGKALDVFAEALDRPSALPPSMSRNGPLFFAQPVRLRHEMHVDVPKGWKPSFQDESSSHASPGFTYRRDLKIEAGRINLTYDMKVLTTDISAGQVPAHVAELRKLRDSLSARLRFQLPLAQQREDRDQRLKSLLKSVIAETQTP